MTITPAPPCSTCNPLQTLPILSLFNAPVGTIVSFRLFSCLAALLWFLLLVARLPKRFSSWRHPRILLLLLPLLLCLRALTDAAAGPPTQLPMVLRQPGNVPVIDEPTLGESPSPSPSPPPPPPAAPPSTIDDGNGNGNGEGTSIPAQDEFIRKPTLDECRFALRRMQVVLLLEFCAELLFLMVRWFGDSEASLVALNFRGFIFARIVYAIPVAAMNISVLWWGSSPTGTCLTFHTEVRLAFTHLLFYALYTTVNVVIGILQMERATFKSSNTRSDENYNSSYSYSLPTRSESYFQTYGPRRSRTRVDSPTSTTDTGDEYDDMKCRINCGCCAFNF